MKVNNLTNLRNFSHPDENQQGIDMSKKPSLFTQEAFTGQTLEKSLHSL